MALSNRAYVRVPPDGAGKALMSDNVRHLEYTNAPGQNAFRVGDSITGSSTGTFAQVARVESTGLSGSLVVSVSDLSSDFELGEDLLVAGLVRGTLVHQEHLYVSKSQIVGSNNPSFGQSVDVLGAASVRFPEGTPNFDAAGRTESSTERWIGIYSQTYDELPRLIQTWSESGGSISYDADSATTRLLVSDSQNSSTIRQTHLYHKYRAGIAQSALMTISAGAVVPGVVRRWGYFDERNGMFFELDGHELSVVVRSDASGSVVERRVPQSEWNGDRLDGSGSAVTNPSQLQFDPTNFWLYEISFLYLGAGSARFAVYVGGSRTTVHTFSNGGVSPRPYMATGTLPLRWEIFNDGDPGQSSEMRQGNSVVFTHGDWAPAERTFGSPFQPNVSVSERTALSVIRAAEQINGRDNRALVMPHTLEVLSLQEPVQVSITRFGEFDITDWAPSNDETILEEGFHLTVPGDPESAVPPPEISEGLTLYSTLVVPGEVARIDLTQVFSVRAAGEVRRNANIEEADTWAMIARSITGNPTDVTLAFNWREII